MRPEAEALVIGRPEPLLRALDDDDLDALSATAAWASHELTTAGLEDASWLVAVHLGGVVRLEQDRRRVRAS